MNRKSFYLLLFLCCNLGIQAQDSKGGYERKKQELRKGFNTFRSKVKTDMQAFRDSANADFAKCLAEAWKEFSLIRQERVFKPMPKPPVYTPDVKPEPEDKKDERDKTPPMAVEPPVSNPVPDPLPDSTPFPDAVETLKGVFFGREIGVRKVDWKVAPLRDTSEKSISGIWEALASTDFKTIVEDAERLKAELRLDDWGTYQLLNILYKMYSPSMGYNEGVVFSVFMLNQMGYQAKIGRADGRLYPLLAVRENVFNSMYFVIGENTKYYVFDSDRKMPSSITCCAMDFKNADKALSLAVKALPVVGDSYKQQLLTFGGKDYRVDYNPMLCNYFSTYPCVDFSVYGRAAMDSRTLSCLEKQLGEEIKGKSEVEAVNVLLHFVQKAFEYKTDDQQYGYEKWNFAEETIIAPYSDCDDRAILFSQLVRRLLGLDVALVHYPGVHLAAAVAFRVPVNGTSIMSGSKKYIICDPTYINANVGMDMPQLRGTDVELFPL